MRADHRTIIDLVRPGSRVLDLGCGDGELLAALALEKGVKGQGIELDEEAVFACVKKGLSVHHGDIDSGLPDFPDGSFDYVILNQSLQEVRHVELALREASRVGRRVVVGFSNFAHIRARWQLAVRGHAPRTPALPYGWYETPNVRFQSLADFRDFAGAAGFRILAERYPGCPFPLALRPNLCAIAVVVEIELVAEKAL